MTNNSYPNIMSLAVHLLASDCEVAHSFFTPFHCCLFIQKSSCFHVTNHHMEVCLFSQRNNIAIPVFPIYSSTLNTLGLPCS